VVDVGPLPATDAEAMLPDQLSGAERSALLGETGGDPFYLLRLAGIPGTAGRGGAAELLEGGFSVLP
jgi:hypothetical protein